MNVETLEAFEDDDFHATISATDVSRILPRDFLRSTANLL
jgi:hypothetical protein